MGRFVHLPEQTLEKIISMHRQGYGYNLISKETKVPVNIVRSRIGKSGRCIKTKNQPNQVVRPQRPQVEIRRGKYDHLFEEPMAKGKMYEEYLKEKNLKIVNYDD